MNSSMSDVLLLSTIVTTSQPPVLLSVSKIFDCPVQTDQSDALPTPTLAGPGRQHQHVGILGSVSLTGDKNTANICHLSLPWLGQRVGGSQGEGSPRQPAVPDHSEPQLLLQEETAGAWNVWLVLGTTKICHLSSHHNRLEDSRTDAS